MPLNYNHQLDLGVADGMVVGVLLNYAPKLTPTHSNLGDYNLAGVGVWAGGD